MMPHSWLILPGGVFNELRQSAHGWVFTSGSCTLRYGMLHEIELEIPAP